MHKRELVWITIAVAAIVLSILPAAQKHKDTLHSDYEMLVRITQKVLDEYVDPVDPDKLFQGAYAGMVSALDPYSQYLPPAAKEEMDVHTTGQYGGLGIEITLDRAGYLTVVTPLEDTPAFRAGVLAGDKILKVDGFNVLSVPLARRLTRAVKLLRGKPGSSVTIHVLHEDGTREDITIVREIINTKSARSVKMISDDPPIGYVRLSQFQEGTAKELDEAVDTLRQQGMHALIVDLRYNPGGLLDEAVAVSDRFLSGGVIVSTRGRTKSSKKTFSAHRADTYPDFPVAVLIGKRSASASEIVSGALQDHHRAVIVGMRSYGKASVQTITQLPDGSGLRLTTARYYTPSGRNIHRNPYEEVTDENDAEWGIKPDFMVPITLKEEMAMLKQWRDEHIIHKEQLDKEKDDGENVPDTVDNPDEAPVPPKEKPDEKEPFVDRQLDVAKTVLKAALLFQGEEGSPLQMKAPEAASVR